MIRVAGLYRQLEAGVAQRAASTIAPARRQIRGIAAHGARAPASRQELLCAALLRSWPRRASASRDVARLEPSRLAYLQRYYDEVVYPILTPMIVGPTPPVPDAAERHPLPGAAPGPAQGQGVGQATARAWSGCQPRAAALHPAQRGDGTVDLVPLESLITTQLPSSSPATPCTRSARCGSPATPTSSSTRRPPRTCAAAIAKKLLGRRHGAAVRIEHGARMEPEVRRASCRQNLELDRCSTIRRPA